jgi:hypothetical protein
MTQPSVLSSRSLWHWHSFFLMLLIMGYAGTAKAADPAHGASCSGFAAGSNACNTNGCFVCTSGSWVDQPLYIGTSSASCDASHEGLRRYNSTTKVMEDCNGTTWTGPGKMQSATDVTTCNSANKSILRYRYGVNTSAPVVASYSEYGDSSGSGAVNIPKPSSTTQGDLLLMMISTDNDGTWTWPAGFTDIGSGIIGDCCGADGQTLGIAWKRATNAEPSNYTTTITSGSLSFASTMLRITGAHPTSPIDVYDHAISASDITAPPAVTITTPSITPLVNNDLILWVATGDSHYTGNYTYTLPSGLTHIAGPNNNSVWSSLEIAGVAQTTATATGTLSGTVDLDNPGTGMSWLGFSVAIRSLSTYDAVEVCNGSNWMTLGIPY